MTNIFILVSYGSSKVVCLLTVVCVLALSLKDCSQLRDVLRVNNLSDRNPYHIHLRGNLTKKTHV